MRKWPQKGLQSLSPSSSLAHLIVITPRPPPSWGRLLLQGKVFLGLEFYRVYFPFFLLIFFKQLLEVSILNGFLTSLWFTFFGLFACLDFGPCPLFIFLSLSWVLFFIKFGKVSSTPFSLHLIWMKCKN
jgi:hypothetical protein